MDIEAKPNATRFPMFTGNWMARSCGLPCVAACGFQGIIQLLPNSGGTNADRESVTSSDEVHQPLLWLADRGHLSSFVTCCFVSACQSFCDGLKSFRRFVNWRRFPIRIRTHMAGSGCRRECILGAGWCQALHVGSSSRSVSGIPKTEICHGGVSSGGPISFRPVQTEGVQWKGGSLILLLFLEGPSKPGLEISLVVRGRFERIQDSSVPGLRRLPNWRGMIQIEDGVQAPARKGRRLFCEDVDQTQSGCWRIVLRELWEVLRGGPSQIVPIPGWFFSWRQELSQGGASGLSLHQKPKVLA